MTQFTSFVAVEEMIVTDGGQPRRIDVPIEVPEGVNRKGVFAEEEAERKAPAKSLMYLSPGVTQSVSETVTVSTSASPINMSSSSTTTVLDQSTINPGSLPASTPAAVREKTKRNRGGSAGTGTGSGGGGSGRGGNVGGGGFNAVEIIAKPYQKEEGRRQLSLKLHPSILAVIDRLKKKEAKPATDEAKFILDGKAEIQIWLTDKSDETLAKLKE